MFGPSGDHFARMLVHRAPALAKVVFTALRAYIDNADAKPQFVRHDGGGDAVEVRREWFGIDLDPYYGAAVAMRFARKIDKSDIRGSSGSGSGAGLLVHPLDTGRSHGTGGYVATLLTSHLVETRLARLKTDAAARMAVIVINRLMLAERKLESVVQWRAEEHDFTSSMVRAMEQSKTDVFLDVQQQLPGLRAMLHVILEGRHVNLGDTPGEPWHAEAFRARRMALITKNEAEDPCWRSDARIDIKDTEDSDSSPTSSSSSSALAATASSSAPAAAPVSLCGEKRKR